MRTFLGWVMSFTYLPNSSDNVDLCTPGLGDYWMGGYLGVSVVMGGNVNVLVCCVVVGVCFEIGVLCRSIDCLRS